MTVKSEYEEIVKLQEQYYRSEKSFFWEHVLFSGQWWLLLALLVFMWLLWLRLVDRERIKSILIVGLITGLLAVVLDDYGISRVLWAYPYKLTYISSRLNPVDLALIPVSYMLIYQYFRKWLSYLAICAVFASGGSFIVEPLFARIDIYWLIDWHYAYSAPIYMAIGILVKGVVGYLERKEITARTSGDAEIKTAPQP